MSNAPATQMDPPLDAVINLGASTWIVSVVMVGGTPGGTIIKNVLSHVPGSSEREAQGTAMMAALAANPGMQISVVSTARITAVPAES